MCIERSEMPQVDGVYLGHLREWLKSQGVTVDDVLIPPRMLRPIQCSSDIKPLHPEEAERALKQPILVSREPKILDGNHRWATDVIEGRDHATCIRINANVTECLNLLKKYPHSYQLGDRKNPHPRRL